MYYGCFGSSRVFYDCFSMAQNSNHETRQLISMRTPITRQTYFTTDASFAFGHSCFFLQLVVFIFTSLRKYREKKKP
jgi:hypothetical protein